MVMDSASLKNRSVGRNTLLPDIGTSAMGRTPTQRDNEYSDEEAERRATDALRQALVTPYKPQRDMVGKVRTPTKPKPMGKRAKKTSPK